MSAPTFKDGPFVYAPTQESEVTMEDAQESSLSNFPSLLNQGSKPSEFSVPKNSVFDERAGYEYSDDEEEGDEQEVEDRLIEEIMFQSIPDWVLELEPEKLAPIRLTLEEHLTGKTIPDLREILRELTKS